MRNIHPHSPTDIVCSIVPVTDGRSIDVYLSAPPSLPGWMDGWMDGRELTLGREGMEMDVRWLVGSWMEDFHGKISINGIVTSWQQQHSRCHLSW